jgi:superkiller protein 3
MSESSFQSFFRWRLIKVGATGRSPLRIVIACMIVLVAADGFSKSRPEQAHEYLLRGQAFLKLQDNPQALAAFQEAVRLDPKLAPAYDGLGIAYCRAGRVDQGREALVRARALDPKNPGYPFSLGICEDSAGPKGYEAALAAFRKAEELDPKNAGVQFQVGSALQKLGRHQDAVAYFQKAIELDPQMSVAYNNLGVSLAALGEYEEAVKLYQQAIKLHPELAGLSLYTNLGIAFLYRNNLPRAEAAFTMETAINPDHLEARLNLGNIYAVQGRAEEAVKEYQRVLQIDPKNHQARLNLAIVFLNQNQPVPAQKTLLSLLQDYPNDPAGHYYLGKTFSLLGDRRQANAEFQRAQSLDFKPEPAAPPAKP